MIKMTGCGESGKGFFFRAGSLWTINLHGQVHPVLLAPAESWRPLDTGRHGQVNFWTVH